MDSNVPKNTNSHNLFKLGVEREKVGISIKNLLKQELLLILNSDRHKFNLQIEPKSFISILENKINLPNFRKHSAKQKQNITYPPAAKFVPIVYSCPIGLLLAAYQRHTPQIIMQQIKQLLSAEGANINLELPLILIRIVDRGWINFYFDSKFMAAWLERSLIWHWQKITGDRQLNQKICSLENSALDLFPVQYIHARCCSLLNLAVRENLISISVDDLWIVKPIATKAFTWLDEQNNLWFKETAERNLMQQLSVVADFWVKEISDREDRKESDRQWTKLALNLSQATAVFLADCRFLGEVKEKYPQLAIARLGLISLVQLWLQRILKDKFAVAAPVSL